jgi:hypothetical protein
MLCPPSRKTITVMFSFNRTAVSSSIDEWRNPRRPRLPLPSWQGNQTWATGDPDPKCLLPVIEQELPWLKLEKCRAIQM